MRRDDGRGKDEYCNINHPLVYKDWSNMRRKSHTLQTKLIMKHELETFVLNRDIPDTIPNSHREVWQLMHPYYKLTQHDIIHHINGNHDDNRPGNLKRVTNSEHHKIHWDMFKNRPDYDII